MSGSVFTFLSTITVLLTLSAARCRFSQKQLPSKIEKYYQCLSDGFDTSVDGCWRVSLDGEELAGKRKRKCAELERYLIKCGVKCENRVETPAVEGDWAVATPGTMVQYNMDLHKGISIKADATYAFESMINFLLTNDHGEPVLDVLIDLSDWHYTLTLWYNSTNGVGVYQEMEGDKVDWSTEQEWRFTVTQEEENKYRVTAACNKGEENAIDAVLHESMQFLGGSFFSDEREEKEEGEEEGWDDVITTLKFSEYWDTASDYYRLLPRDEADNSELS